MTVAALAVAGALAAVAEVRAQGMMRGMGPMMGLGILRSNEAKEELKLSNEQSEKIDALMEQMRSSMMERFQALQDVPEEERQEKAQTMMRELAADVKKELRAVLDADQFARYEQINLQAMGVDAFLQPEVIEQLKITAEQQEKLQQAVGTMREQMMEISQSAQRDREGAMRRMTELRQSTQKKVMELMTADQKSAWEKMIGKPFQMPAFGGGFGGGRPRRPPG
jgi:Spy/CpxP family protein refolding chaperone